MTVNRKYIQLLPEEEKKSGIPLVLSLTHSPRWLIVGILNTTGMVGLSVRITVVTAVTLRELLHRTVCALHLVTPANRRTGEMSNIKVSPEHACTYTHTHVFMAFYSLQTLSSQAPCLSTFKPP